MEVTRRLCSQQRNAHHGQKFVCAPILWQEMPQKIGWNGHRSLFTQLSCKSLERRFPNLLQTLRRGSGNPPTSCTRMSGLRIWKVRHSNPLRRCQIWLLSITSRIPRTHPRFEFDKSQWQHHDGSKLTPSCLTVLLWSRLDHLILLSSNFILITRETLNNHCGLRVVPHHR